MGSMRSKNAPSTRTIKQVIVGIVLVIFIAEQAILGTSIRRYISSPQHDDQEQQGGRSSSIVESLRQPPRYSFDLKRWLIEEPVCSSSDYQMRRGHDETRADDMIAQLHQRVLNSKSKWAQAKTTSFAAIREAQCIQMELFSQLLGRFKYAILLDVATFENKGDPAISLGELLLLKRLGIRLLDYCVTGSCTKEVYTQMKANITAQGLGPNDVVVLFHGGGNLVRKHLHRNLTMVFRDEQSLQVAHKHFATKTGDKDDTSTNRVLLAPDMAFRIGSLPRTMVPTRDIIWLKRTDGESQKYDVPKLTGAHTINNHTVTIKFDDWWTNWPSPKAAGNDFDRIVAVTHNGLAFLQRGRVLVTDPRLHGHILSTMLDIPHVILDTAWGKVSSYHRTWTAGMSNVAVADNATHALDLAVELLHKYDREIPDTLP